MRGGRFLNAKRRARPSLAPSLVRTGCEASRHPGAGKKPRARGLAARPAGRNAPPAAQLCTRAAVSAAARAAGRRGVAARASVRHVTACGQAIALALVAALRPRPNSRCQNPPLRCPRHPPSAAPDTRTRWGVTSRPPRSSARERARRSAAASACTATGRGLSRQPRAAEQPREAGAWQLLGCHSLGLGGLDDVAVTGVGDGEHRHAEVLAARRAEVDVVWGRGGGRGGVCISACLPRAARRARRCAAAAARPRPNHKAGSNNAGEAHCPSSGARPSWRAWRCTRSRTCGPAGS